MLKIITEFADENIFSTLKDDEMVVESVKCSYEEGLTLDSLVEKINEKLLKAINIELYTKERMGKCSKCGEFLYTKYSFLEVGEEVICNECLAQMSSMNVASFCGYDMTKVKGRSKNV